MPYKITYSQTPDHSASDITVRYTRNKLIFWRTDQIDYVVIFRQHRLEKMSQFFNIAHWSKICNFLALKITILFLLRKIITIIATCYYSHNSIHKAVCFLISCWHRIPAWQNIGPDSSCAENFPLLQDDLWPYSYHIIARSHSGHHAKIEMRK